MGSFTSGAANIFIIVGTLGGFAAMLWLIKWMSKGQPPGEKVETMGHVWDEDLTELNNPLPRWWLNLFYITLVFGFVYLLLYPGLGSNDMLLQWTQIESYEAEMAEAEKTYGPIFARHLEKDVAEVAKDAGALKIGRRLYANYCATCHGVDARGLTGFPNLTDDDWLWGGTPEAIEASIAGGREAAMPAWGAALGEEGVRSTAQYVMSLSGKEADATQVAAGKAHYDKLCIGCHGKDGTGNQTFGAPNLANGKWLYGGSSRIIEKSIADGRNGKMPPHGEFLGEAKVHLLAAYIYSLSN